MQLQASSHAVWDQMSDEVWCTILSCLKPQLEDTHDYRRHRLETHNQSWFLSLQSVCKKFYRVFESNPQLCSNLRLDKQRRSWHFVQLLNWSRRHIPSITCLAATCGSPCLDTAYVELPNGHTLSLLAAFRNLTHCILFRPRALTGGSSQVLSQAPLEDLPSLTILKVIEAGVTDIEALAHLTALDLKRSRISCRHNFRSVTSLSRLHLDHATILQFHDRGVLACTRLLSLTCQEAFVEAVDVPCCLIVKSDDHLMLPHSLVELTALTRLTLCGAVMPQQQSSLKWVSQLTSLQDFVYNLPFEHVKLSEGVAALTRLTSLHVWGYEVPDQVLPQLAIDIDWAPFHLLKCAVFGGVIEFSAKLKDLAALRTLELLSVYDMQGDRRASQEWIKLAHWFGVHRPQLVFEYTHFDPEEPYEESEGGAEYATVNNVYTSDSAIHCLAIIHGPNLFAAWPQGPKVGC